MDFMSDKKIYRLKSFKPDAEFYKRDLEHKERIEEVLGRKFMNDYEWVQYKQLTMPKDKNSKK